MTERVDGLVTQVIEPDDRGGYAIPSEILDGLEDDEDLIVVTTDPHPEWLRQIWAIPILGSMIEVLLSLLLGFISLIPGVDPEWFDTGGLELAAENVSLSKGEWVEIEIEEAVVSTRTSRGELVNREVHLREIVDVLDRLDERPSESEPAQVAQVVDRKRLQEASER